MKVGIEIKKRVVFYKILLALVGEFNRTILVETNHDCKGLINLLQIVMISR